MKTVLLFVILTLIGVGSYAQTPTDNPVLPRVYEDGYSIDQIKEFALGKRPGVNHEYASNYRQKLLSIINEGLRRSGEYVNVNNGEPVDESWVEWIYDQVERVYNDSLPAGHRNTWHNGNQVSWTSKKQKKYYGPLDRFVYGVCIIKLDKPSCANLVPDYSLLGYVKQIEPEKLKQRPELKVDNKLPPDYGGEKKSVVVTKVDTTKKVNPSVAKIGKVKKSKEDKTWVGNNLWIIPAGLAFIGGTIWVISELSKDDQTILIQEEEFNPVDALPQAKLIRQTRGLTVSFNF